MITSTDAIFYLTFLGQIFLISYYLPGRLLDRMRRVLTTYPPETYPKLYPKPLEYYRIGHATFEWVNRAIVALGLLVFVLMLTVVDHSTFADDGSISEAWPAFYGMLQFLPLALLEFTECGQFKLMRRAKTATRKAELRPRRFFDFVSPLTLTLTIALFLASVLFELWAHQFQGRWGLVAILAFGNLFMAAAGARIMYGPNPNPHQASADRARQLRANLPSLFYVSMVMSIFYMTLTASDLFDLDFLGAILMSLYFQVIVLFSIGHILRTLRLEDIDFDVYRAESPAG
ncbi:MAG: hypothetical protein K8J08_03895 [Thermoanaerobaculia bacterium]|nr:hypothetical protein [Thermoanaerobaculia bacterium]